MQAFENLFLIEYAEKFVLKPDDVGTQASVLEIDRSTSEFSLIPLHKFSPTSTPVSSKKIYGCLGAIRLLSGLHLIVITQRSSVGSVAGNQIWRVDGASLVLVSSRPTSLSGQQRRDEEIYKSMIRSVIAARSFYTSYTVDITASMQSLASTPSPSPQRSLWKNANPHFFWNQYLMKDFVDNQLEGFILPVIRGFVEIKEVAGINGRSFTFALVSRGSCRRAGTRFNMRGIDEDGNVANAAETEQIVVVDGQVASYMLTRGSIPLYWSQSPNLKYKPKPTLESTSHRDPKRAFAVHFEQQLAQYGCVVVVNLVDQKGSEKTLADEFEASWKSFSNADLKYVAFDFHKQCSKMRYDRLSLLVDQVKKDIESFGYFYRDSTSSEMSQQKGVFRVNCIDCLDRTNVVQSLFAGIVLQEQLVALGVFRKGETIKDHPTFDYTFKNIWADNADAVSKLYSGTGALKTDYTRTGKRGPAGALNDGVNSAVRYYLNNFRDGTRQDATNLFLGVYQVDPKAPSPFVAPTNSAHVGLKLGFWLGSTMAILNQFVLPEDASLLHRLGFIGACGGMALLALSTIVKRGKEFVDNPRLSLIKKVN